MESEKIEVKKSQTYQPKNDEKRKRKNELQCKSDQQPYFTGEHVLPVVDSLAYLDEPLPSFLGGNAVDELLVTGFAIKRLFGQNALKFPSLF